MIQFPAEYIAVLTEAREQWGDESQIQVAFGECGEFVTLAGRMAQNRAVDDDFIDEIADCMIMMVQMREIFGEAAVDARVAYKIQRLNRKLQKLRGVDNEA
jgi:hypothetical protein